MNSTEQLHHNLITIPQGKQAANPVAERHDIVLLFDCAKSNPNGDPDTGNMPRVQPDSLKGLVTDVCLKRKIRNFFTLFNPNNSSPGIWNDSEDRNGYNIFIRENAVFQEFMEAEDIAIDAEKIFNGYIDPKKGKWKRPAKGKAADSEFIARAFRDALCSRYVDLRAFGGVISTEGPLKGSFYGQVRGPLQITFAESLDKVLPLDATITRCAVASIKEQQQAAGSEEEATNRTMGRKHGIDYGLYRSHIHFSPAFAAKTGFSYYDLDNFLFALQHMFDDDHAAGRHLRLVGLVDFQHQSALGNAPAHKLFDLVKVDGVTKEDDDKKIFASSDSEFPRSLSDYSGNAPGAEDKHIPVPGYEAKGITARKVVWEIPSSMS